MRNGKQLYMLIKEVPVGIVSIKGSLIENLYVVPSEQHKGYGSELLLFAMKQCKGSPRLWVLNNNEKAQSFYCHHHFHMTGNRHRLSEQLSEWEMEI